MCGLMAGAVGCGPAQAHTLRSHEDHNPMTRNGMPGDPSKVNSCERPTLDERERDSLGARLRYEHRRVVAEPLPDQMRDLLSKLAKKG
jgi:hypothetical protein